MPALPLPQPEGPPAFETGTHRRLIKGSAARSTVLTIYAFAVVLLDFVALAIYFGAR
jgi:hypothetical protein